ncbi:MAG: hypothetical protein JNJ43_09120 [Anaerolineales bacterium]|nr:hypothetical protein [Anaerolineales bacterium]
MKRIHYFILISLLMLTACNLLKPPPVVISECFPSRQVFVWEDSNGNGQVDAGEKPLANIPVTMINARTGSSQNTSSDGAKTDAEGKVTMHGIGDFGEKCDEIIIQIKVPSDYLPTTPTEIHLIGLPHNEVTQFGLISQFPTPQTLDPQLPFQACTLFTLQAFDSILGVNIEYELIDSGSIGENGMLTVDCMTDPAEPNLFMYAAIAIENSAEQAESFFQEDIGLLTAQPEPIDDLGESAYFWTSEDDALHYVSVLQNNLYFKITLGFWLGDSPDNKERVIEFAKFMLERLKEQGTP